MHERGLLRELLGEIERVAAVEGAQKVTRIEVCFGPLSHFTPEHFAEHFVDASRGTIAEGADVVSCLDEGLAGDAARGVVLESVEVEV